MNRLRTTAFSSGNTTSLLDPSWGQSTKSQGSFASAYIQNEVTHTLWLLLPPLLLLLGCYGNVMTVVVMRGMRRSEVTACLSVYFTALAVSDLFALCSSVIWYWPEVAFSAPVSYFHDVTCSLLIFVPYASSMTSAWLLMTMTAQRLMAVVVPHRVGVLCTVKRGKIITAGIVSIGCLTNGYIFFMYHVAQAEEGYSVCVSSSEQLANIFGYIDLCLASVIPFLFLILANSFLIYRSMQSVQTSRQMGEESQTKSRSAKASSMTRTLIATSLAFLVLTLPNRVLYVYLEVVGFYKGNIVDKDVNETLALAESVGVLLWISNGAINFYVYILSGRRFREEAKQYFFCLRAKHPQASAARTTW